MPLGTRLWLWRAYDATMVTPLCIQVLLPLQDPNQTPVPRFEPATTRTCRRAAPTTSRASSTSHPYPRARADSSGSTRSGQ